jgi:hypothetical protein
MYTAYDAIEYLMSSTGGGAQDSEHRILRQSLFHAYRDLVTARDWRWYQASELLELAADNDITTHTLPWGVQSVDSVALKEPHLLADYVDPTEWHRTTNSPFRQLVRLIWTVLPSQFSPDRYDLKILNGYRYRQSLMLTYRRRPKDLRFTGWEPASRVGKINWTGTEVVGTDTQFSNQMLGCVLRVSGNPDKCPESMAGIVPYRDEGLIVDIDSTTKAFAWSPAKIDKYEDSRYIVTDYLDISPGMYTALLSGAEAWLSRLTGKNIEGAMGVYGRDLRMAYESDAVAPLAGRRDRRGIYYQFWYLRPGGDGGVIDPGTGGGGVIDPGTGGGNGQCPLKPDISGGDAVGSSSDLWDGGSAGTVFGACGNASQ